MMVFYEQVADSQHGSYRPVENAEGGQRSKPGIVGESLRLWQPDDAQAVWQRDGNRVFVQYLRCSSLACAPWRAATLRWSSRSGTRGPGAIMASPVA